MASAKYSDRTKKLMQMFASGAEITSWLAIESLGETRLASRVFEMKEKYGLNFLTRAIKQNVDDKKPFIGYRLCPESKQRMLDILAGKAYSTAKIGG